MNKNGFSAILGIFICLVLLGGGLFFYWWFIVPIPADEIHEDNFFDFDTPRENVLQDPVSTDPTLNYIEETAIPGQKRFVSQELGISFLFMDYADAEISVYLDENKVYVYPTLADRTSGQYVEVFSKDESILIQEAIARRFLQGNYLEACKVIYSESYGGYVIESNLSPGAFEDIGEYLALVNSTCPMPYTATNGINYFVGNALTPDKYVYFSIGQYVIMGTPEKAWQETLEFL